ncbi:protein FAR1-RELATED SEQUENCE 5-like [Zea mays]|uniref:protein FAR1-RELATED SEQUENCE 5-like n=1 Tax=Zea mays TaxID=4577 RepID=UPI00165306DE|nr:protein FAR1-RELATED SEQUENCE 5-like [Zea mays]
MEEDATNGSNMENVLPCLIPRIGMKFRNPDEGSRFWLAYSGQKGFDVRKRYSNTSKIDGNVTSCRFVCANQGHRGKDKKGYEVKCHRAETRTDCEVRMGLVKDKEFGGYKVYDLNLEHNHNLHLPETFHLMVSQRKISDLQAFEIETADDSGIGPKASHELACRQVGGPLNLSYTIRDHKNYLRGKRQREMVYGQAGSMLKYFQDKMAENPAFQYATQMDAEEKIANIFWADARMIADYIHFVLDLMNIKSLPTQYILKRWTRQARSGTIQDKNGRIVIENPKFDAMRRYRYFSQKLLNLAHRAAYYPECTSLMDNTIDLLGQQIEDKINICSGPSNAEKNATQVDIVVPNDTLSNAQLKKKEVRIRSSKRQKFGWEGKHKGRKKGQSKNILHVQAPKAQEVKETSNPASIDIQFHKKYNTINSFTQLLTGASSDDLKTENFFEL